MSTSVFQCVEKKFYHQKKKIFVIGGVFEIENSNKRLKYCKVSCCMEKIHLKEITAGGH